MSTFGGVDTLLSALRAQALAQSVINQNITNATTAGYSREVPVLTASSLINLPSFDSAFSPAQVGQGTQLQTIERIRDEFLDIQTRAQLSAQGEHQALLSAAQSMAVIFPELNATPGAGLVTALSTLFTEFNALAAAPASGAVRATVVADAQHLAALFQSDDQTLARLQTTEDQNVRSTLDRINGYLQQIASANATIVQAQAAGALPVNTVVDARSEALANLAKLINVDTVNLADGSVLVLTGNARTLVRGAQASTFTPLTGTHTAAFADVGLREQPNGPIANLTTEIGSGQLKGLLEARDGTVANERLALDALANSLMAEVNTVQQAGYAQDGVTTNIPFFLMPGGVTGNRASDFVVNPAIVANPSLIGASGLAGNGADGSQAQSLANLSTSIMNATAQSTGLIDNLTGTIDPSQPMNSIGHTALNGPNPFARNSTDFLIPPAAAGTLNVNGVSINWANTDSIQAIIAKINNPALGLGVTASFDFTRQAVTLFSQGPLKVFDQVGNLTASLRLETRVASLAAINNDVGPADNPVVIGNALSSSLAQYRTDAQGAGVITINGVSVAWNSGQSLLTIRNNLNAALAPVGLKVAFTAGTQTLTVTGSVPLPATAANPIGPVSIIDTAGNLSQVLNLEAQPTFSAFGAGLVSGMQAQLSNAQAMVDQDNAAVTQLQTQQAALSQVNLDQEKQALTESALAYQAAVQAMTVLDSVMNTLINRMAVSNTGVQTTSVLSG